VHLISRADARRPGRWYAELWIYFIAIVDDAPLDRPPYQLPSVWSLPTVVSTGDGESGFDSGEGAREMATASKERQQARKLLNLSYLSQARRKQSGAVMVSRALGAVTPVVDSGVRPQNGCWQASEGKPSASSRGNSSSESVRPNCCA